MKLAHHKLVWAALSEKGYLSHDDAIAVARRDGYHREAEVERRLRPSESPCVEAVMGFADGVSFVKGYRWCCEEKYKPETRAEKKQREAQEKTDSYLARLRAEGMKYQQ